MVRARRLWSPRCRGRIGDLLLGYLGDLIGMLRKQLVVFGDTEWLKKQSAGEMAVLHGVCVDKTVRLLEALEAGGNKILRPRRRPEDDVSDAVAKRGRRNEVSHAVGRVVAELGTREHRL